MTPPLKVSCLSAHVWYQPLGGEEKWKMSLWCSVRWHQAWCSPTRCVRSVHVVGRSVWGGVCWEQLLAGYGSGSVQQSFLCSSCLFLLSSLHKCCQRLIPCALCNVPSAQMWIRKKPRSCNQGRGRVCIARVHSVKKSTMSLVYAWQQSTLCISVRRVPQNKALPRAICSCANAFS